MTAQLKESSADRRPASLRGSDAELLQATAAGNERAFAELCGRYGGAIARVCRLVAGSEWEDCEQEVFARVWAKAALFDPARGSAAAWLLTLARRTALNVEATKRKRPAAPRGPVVDVGSTGDLDRFWLAAVLERLPERERTVVELAYYHDLSESVIARRLRVPVGSVKSWKRRGLNRLAQLLGEEGP